MNRDTFLNSFGHIADAPGGVGKLRRLILDLAMRGRLTERRDQDEPVTALLARVDRERDRKVRDREMRRPRHAMDPIAGAAPHDIPESWRWVRTVRVAQVVGGGTPNVGDPTNFEDDGIPWITPADMGKGKVARIVRGRRGLSEKGYASCSATLMPKGTLVFSSRAPIGYVAVAANDLCTNQGFKSLVPHAMECSPFLYWALLAYAPLIEERGSGTTFSEVSGGVMEAVPLPFPPIQEQHRIAETVSGLMTLCDELESQQTARVDARLALTGATLHQVTDDADAVDGLRVAIGAFAENVALHLAPGDGDIAALKRLRQAILDLAIRGRLTPQGPADEPAAELLDRIALERDRLVKAKEIRKPKLLAVGLDMGDLLDLPRGWEASTLGHLVLSSDSGWSPACVPSVRSHDSDWGVLKVSAVSWGHFRPDEHKLLTPGLVPRPQMEVRDGDFLMSRANTSELVGRSVVVSSPPPRLMLSDKHVRLRFMDRVTAEFVNLVNSSSTARAYYASVASGTSDSMRNVTRDQILGLQLPLPPLAEQRRIVQRVAELNKLCDALEQQLVAARALRADLTASVVAHSAATASHDEGSAA